jgi:two-component sensor histidine kinase
MEIECSTQWNERDTTHDLLVAELQHRIRNLLTLVQYLIAQTQSDTVREYRCALTARIRNLADGYELIEHRNGIPVPLAGLLERTLRPYAAVWQDRIQAAGPDIHLEPRLGLALHLIFHELATNACKHGALANSSGRIKILWDVEPDESNRRLVIQWRESDGPRVRSPERKGFGLNLITQILAGSIVQLNFEQRGMVCRILIGVRNVAPNPKWPRTKPLPCG